VRALLALLVLALSACRTPVEEVPVPVATLTVTARSVYTTIRWPTDAPGDTVTFNSSFDDDAGLAGIEIEITDVAGGLVRTHHFDVRDLEEGIPPYEVPESGKASALLRLTQHAKVVAIGVAEWPLQPRIQWEVEIERAPRPLNAAVPRERLKEARPPCFWWWCQGVWRFDINEDAVNYPDEALWLTVWAVDPTSCEDLCFDG